MNPQEIGDSATSNQETSLYHQEFLAYPECTVKDVLTHVGWKVKYFLRFESGETINTADI